MPGFHLHPGNRMEALVEALAQTLDRWNDPADGRDAFEPDWIVVQSSGLERFLSLELARRNSDRRPGIAANIRFLAPQRLLKRLLGYDPGELFPFDRERAALQLYRLLDELPDRPELQSAFAGVAAYLGDGDPLKRYQLADKLSSLFDQYLIHRTDWIAAWSEGASPDAAPDPDGAEASAEARADLEWQGLLWRALQQSMPGLDFAGRWNTLCARIDSLAIDPDAPREWQEDDAIPARIAWFGISHLPALHRQLLARLRRVADVQLFTLQAAPVLVDPQARLADLRAPLLRSCGRTAMEFASELLQSAPDPVVLPHFPGAPSPGAATSAAGVGTITPDPALLLNRVQRDLRDNRDPALGEPEELAPDDTIVLHNCYSPLREVEALRDWLLEQFVRNPDLRPDEIVALTPDIATYAPLVDAVFGNPETPEQRLPYSIADAPAGAVQEWNRAFLAALDLSDERFAATRVMELLEATPVRQRFELDAEQVRYWLREAEIRWGMDAQGREAAGLPAIEIGRAHV